VCGLNRKKRESDRKNFSIKRSIGGRDAALRRFSPSAGMYDLEEGDDFIIAILPPNH
jgi:hypothetical protein